MTPADLATRLHAQRSGLSTMEDCRKDVDMALAIAGGTVPSFVVAVRIAGERVARARLKVRILT